MRGFWVGCAALALVGFGTATARADVTGTFNIDITLFPQGTQTEAVKFDIDLMSNFQFNSTFSGLTLGADLGFGVTGVEFSILKLAANLGALTFRQDGVFAVPFGCKLFLAPVGNGPDAQLGGACPGNRVVQIGDADGDNTIDPNAVGFVKSRTEIELNVAGITIQTLVLFEDVDFPDIHGVEPLTGFSDHEHDHFSGALPYHVYGLNGETDDQTPTYGAGAVLSISGQTVSGITLVSETAFCAAGRNHIKKRAWAYEVNKACSMQDVGFVIEGGGSPFLVDEQRFWLRGLGGEGASIDLHAAFSPLHRSMEGAITASFTVAEVATLLATGAFTSSGLRSLILELTSGNAQITLTDLNLDLTIDAGVAVFSFILNPEANPMDLTVKIEGDGQGLSDFTLSLGWRQGMMRFASETLFSRNAATHGFDWTSTGFGLSGRTDSFSFGTDFSFSVGGISAIHLTLGFLF